MRSYVSTSPYMSCSVDISWSSMIPLVGAVVVSATATVASYCMATFCSQHILSTDFAMCIFISFFYYCATIFSNLAKFGVHHAGGNVAITLKIASSIVMNGSVTHVWVGSFHVRIYRLSISSLNSVVLCKWLSIVGDNRGLQSIHVRILASINTQNTLISWILMASFITQSKLYLTASGRFISMLGKWLPFGSSPTTSRINRSSHS